MPGKSQKIRLKKHLWSQLDGMAEGMGATPEDLLKRAVTTLLNLHGYPVERPQAVISTDPGVPPFTPEPPAEHALKATFVPPRAPVPLDKLPVITGIASGTAPTLQQPQQQGIPSLKGIPATANLRMPKADPTGSQKLPRMDPTANLRAPKIDIALPAKNPFDDDRPTQYSYEHNRRRPAGPPQPLPERSVADELEEAAKVEAALEPAVPVEKVMPATDDDEAPFVSDVIPVPPELYAPEDRTALELPHVPKAAEPEEEEQPEQEDESTQAASEAPADDLLQKLNAAIESVSRAITAGGESEPESGPTHVPEVESMTAPSSTPRPPVESMTAPRSEPTHVPELESMTAPRSEPTQVPELESTSAPRSEPTHVPELESMTAPRSEPTQIGEESAVSSETAVSAPVDVTHGLSSETEVGEEDQTHGVSEESSAPVSEELNTAVSEELSAPADELSNAPIPEERFNEPEVPSADVPWVPEPERLSAPRPKVSAPRPPVPTYEEPPPPAQLPPPDSDPARISAANRIRAIAAELEQWVLPRDDRSFTIDVPAAGMAADASSPKAS